MSTERTSMRSPRPAGRVVGLGLIVSAALLAFAAAVMMALMATAAPGDTRTLVAAGDLVCSPATRSYDGNNPNKCQHRRTDDLLAGADAVALLGDLQYPDGRLEHFNQAYHPTWGQHVAKSFPAPGNHEYNTPRAQGYFDYWASHGRPTGGVGNGYHGVRPRFVARHRPQLIEELFRGAMRRRLSAEQLARV